MSIRVLYKDASGSGETLGVLSLDGTGGVVADGPEWFKEMATKPMGPPWYDHLVNPSEGERYLRAFALQMRRNTEIEEG